jgi:hypothetical protein
MIGVSLEFEPSEWSYLQATREPLKTARTGGLDPPLNPQPCPPSSSLLMSCDVTCGGRLPAGIGRQSFKTLRKIYFQLVLSNSYYFSDAVASFYLSKCS